MLIEVLFLALVIAIALLIAVDLSRTPSESPHVHADRQAHEVESAVVPSTRTTEGGAAPRRTSAGARGQEAVVAAADAGLPRRIDGISPPAGARRPSTSSRTTPAAKGSHGSLKTWHVRSRLALLAIIAAAAASIVTVSVIRIASAAQRHSQNGSARGGASTSVLVASILVVIVAALAVLVLIIVARSVLSPLQRLRTGTLETAYARLPDRVHVINERGGEGVPLDVKPIQVGSADEIAEVAQAFDQVHGQALRLAASEAAIRSKLHAMFVNLSHRSESLTERQLRLIDDLEQAEPDPDRLAKLFKLDHLASRMRRYSQNLLVLAGHELSGQWDRPMALINAIRAAVSEIEEYERVSLTVQPGIAVRAPAVGDLVHLLAELTENATSLSAANTPVVISGRRLATGGVLIDITDRGFGMSPEEMAHANWRLENLPPEITAYRSMGLFVVGRLAARHGIRVRLQPAETGGLTALVWLPDSVILQQEAGNSPELSGDGSARTGARSPEPFGAGRHGRIDPDRAAAE
jgi:signal transduction histidine kinase